MHYRLTILAGIVVAGIAVMPTLLSAEESDLIWSTFIGGGDNEEANGIAVDLSGNVYLIGSTRSTGFPATSGAFDTTYNDKTDAFVVRINATGERLDYATFLGGNGGDRGYSIAVDDSACAYAVGFTYSENFPVTAGAYDTEHNSPGGVYNDVFVAKLNRKGDAILYATFIGGKRGEGGYGLDLDASGSVYVSGDTESSDFPVTEEAYDTTYNDNKDIFVVKLNPSGNDLEYATFIGGGNIEFCGGIDVDGSGAAYVIGETQSTDFPTTAGAFDETYNEGHDAFVFKLSPSGSVLEYGSFMGGNQWDRGMGVAVDDSGGLYLTGYTNSTGFPHTWGSFDPYHNGGRDAFVVKLDIAEGNLIYGSFLGGEADDRGCGIAIDDSGCAYLTGRTSSQDFPSTPGAFDVTPNGDDDVFVTKFSPEGNLLLYATLLGGESYEYGNGIALGGIDQVYVTGVTNSSDFPITAGAFDPMHNGWDDIFAAKLQLSITSVAPVTTDAHIPTRYTLQQNYPNPFNSLTQIEYDIPKAVPVTLRIYNIRGAEVTTLVDGLQPVGSHVVKWNAADQASGVYFCIMEAEEYRAVRKMVLLK